MSNAQEKKHRSSRTPKRLKTYKKSKPKKAASILQFSEEQNARTPHFELLDFDEIVKENKKEFEKKRKRKTSKTQNSTKRQKTNSESDNIEDENTGKQQISYIPSSSGNSIEPATKCTICGMLYQEGSKEEVVLHDTHCSSYQKLIQFTGLGKIATVAETIENSNSQSVSQWIVAPAHSSTIFVLNLSALAGSTLTPAQKSKIEEIKNRVDTELGITETFEQFMSRPYKMYMYVTTADSSKYKKPVVVGVIIAESIKTAFHAAYEDSQQAVIEETKPIKAHIGISRVWVHSSYRRKGIASSLLDAARKNQVYGFQVEKEHIAFSQPTRDGKQLAEKYLSNTNFLEYKAKTK